MRIMVTLIPAGLKGFGDFGSPFLRLYNGDPGGQQFGPKCSRGDRIGCGIHSENVEAGISTVFFTKNSKEVCVLPNQGVVELLTSGAANRLCSLPGWFLTRPLRWVLRRSRCLWRGCSQLWPCTQWGRR